MDKDEEYPDIATVHRMFNDAFGTKERELDLAKVRINTAKAALQGKEKDLEDF